MKPEVLVSIAGLSGLLLGFNLAKRRKTDTPDQKSAPDRFHGLDDDKSIRLWRRDGSSCTPSPVGQDHSRIIYGLGEYSQQSRVMLCMVGLPARGKSYITKMLTRYLRWTGFPVEVFNAGDLRRQEGHCGATADFFRDDKDATALREQVASACMEQAFMWLNSQRSVCVAIFDATNTTKKRRQAIVDRCRQTEGITPVFIESICDDEKLLEQNYSMKLENNDYKGMDPVLARADFLARIKNYEHRYEVIDDDEADGEIGYIKIFNVGRKVTMHRCTGYVVSKIGFYLSNIHISPRSIFITRPGETKDEAAGKLGSVSVDMTRKGRIYCRNLASFLLSRREEMRNAGDGEGAETLVLMGTTPVHGATLNELSSRGVTASLFPAMSTSLLNELDRGVCNGMTYEQIQAEFPDVLEERQRDKLHFRYPGLGGESYLDVVGRVHPIIIELERQRQSVIVICQTAVQKCILAYFTGCPMEELPFLEMGAHTVTELRPGPFGCTAQRHTFD